MVRRGAGQAQAARLKGAIEKQIASNGWSRGVLKMPLVSEKAARAYWAKVVPGVVQRFAKRGVHVKAEGLERGAPDSAQVLVRLSFIVDKANAAPRVRSMIKTAGDRYVKSLKGILAKQTGDWGKLHAKVKSEADLAAYDQFMRSEVTPLMLQKYRVAISVTSKIIYDNTEERTAVLTWLR